MIVTISSCKGIINVEQFIDQSKDNNEEEKMPKKQMEIRFSCGENSITTYLDQGWIILEESTEEKYVPEIVLLMKFVIWKKIKDVKKQCLIKLERKIFRKNSWVFMNKK